MFSNWHRLNFNMKVGNQSELQKNPVKTMTFSDEIDKLEGRKTRINWRFRFF